MTPFEHFLSSAIRAGTLLLLAALGELYAERSGVLNLGVEGIMAMGAFTGLAVAFLTQNLILAAFIAALVGCLLSLIHAFLCITLKSNQIISGLALAMFGLGLSQFLGHPFTGLTIDTFDIVTIPLLSDIPIIRAFFRCDPFVYVSYALIVLLWFILFKTSIGLNIRSVGESPEVADALGINVTHVRYACTVFGGFFAGLAGAYLTLVLVPFWIAGMTAGRGWIALAIVIVSLWNPLYTLPNAYLFGALWVFYFHYRLVGASPWLLQTVPYIASIITLTVLSRVKKWAGAPSALTKPYKRE